MTPDPAEEIIDHVDGDDQVIGQVTRGEAYARGLRHRCAFILARDPQGRIFVHRRTATKLVYPGMYDMFVGGVLGAGESYDEGALREAEEELGVPGLAQPTPLLKFLFDNGEGKSWWSYLYEVTVEGPVEPQAEEIDWHAFLTPQELEQRLGEWAWTPDGLTAYARWKDCLR